MCGNSPPRATRWAPMKAYREETNVDLRTAAQVIESLYGG